jgi:DNA replication and repair protein RecF
VHYGTQGFSPRTRRDLRAIRFGSDAARVETSGRRGNGVPYRTQVTLGPAGVKQIELDGAPLPTADELRRHFPVLAFTPDRLAVVKGGPLIRRTYLDRMLGRLSPAQASVPVEYARALAQRNASLRRLREGATTREALRPWTTALARLGTELDDARSAAVSALAEPFAASAAELGLDDATLEYEARRLTVEELDARLERDLARGTTGAGPHLRDVRIAAGTRDLRSFGSQGEQRLAVLALLLAEARLHLADRGDPPLLLLDDVMSELDDTRRRALLTLVPAGCQTLVTATSDRSLPSGADVAAIVDVTPGRASVR